MFAGTARLLKKAQRRLWMKYALRGVGGSDNHSRLDLAGGMVEGRMVLEQQSRDEAGKSLRQRVTWTSLPDGRVRQVWETSADDGAAWKTVSPWVNGTISSRSPCSTKSGVLIRRIFSTTS